MIAPRRRVQHVGGTGCKAALRGQQVVVAMSCKCAQSRVLRRSSLTHPDTGMIEDFRPRILSAGAHFFPAALRAASTVDPPHNVAGKGSQNEKKQVALKRKISSLRFQRWVGEALNRFR